MLIKTKRQLYNLSLKYKIIVLSLVIAIVPLFAFTIIVTNVYNKAMEERSQRHIKESLAVINDRIDGIFKDLEICSNYLTININNVISDNEDNEVKIEGLINNQLHTSKIIFGEIDSIIYIDTRGKFFTTDYQLLNKEEAIKKSTYLKQLTKTTGKTVLFDLKETCMSMANDYSTITLGKKVIKMTSGETLGYLFINIKGERITSSTSNPLSQYVLLDTQNRIVEDGVSNTLIQGFNLEQAIKANTKEDVIKYKGIHYMISRHTSQLTNWSIIGITNMDESNVDIKKLVSVWLHVGGILTILLIIFLSVLTHLITKPLTQLKEGAERIASGDMSVRFHFKGGDEIGKLGAIFNDMMEKIMELLARVDAEAKKKREYELALIQEQVKPHFLYNTLDIIIMLSQMNKNREAQRVTKKLADYYKNSLSDSKEVVTLEREIRIIEDYLELQMMRYEDKFTYTINIEYGTQHTLIPKMTLQPLIENAIYHGIKYKEGWGNILVESKLVGDHIEVTVIDDGIGMTKEQLEHIIYTKAKPKGHFGVYSVDHRLRLFYGEGYGIEVESEYTKGTQIKIRLPRVK